MLQLSSQQLDNMTLLDVMMNTLSAAEKLVFGKYEGKKYGYYDEKNTCEWKNIEQRVRELRIQKECLQSMIKLFEQNSGHSNYCFPDNLNKEEIIEDLQILKMEVKKMYPKNNYFSIYDDIINILNNKGAKAYTFEEIYPNSSKKNNSYNEKDINLNVRNMLKTKEQIINKDKEFEKSLMENNGIIQYNAVLYVPREGEMKNKYYKNLYSNAYNNNQ